MKYGIYTWCYLMFYHIITVTDSEKGEALLVLCEEELLAFDLKATKYLYL